MKAPFVHIIRRVSDRRKVHALVDSVRQLESRLEALEGLRELDRQTSLIYKIRLEELVQARTELKQLIKSASIKLRPTMTRRWIHLGRHKVYVRVVPSGPATLAILRTELSVVLWNLNGPCRPWIWCRKLAEKISDHYALLLKRRRI